MYREEGEKCRLICGKRTLLLQLSVETKIKTILISSLKINAKISTYKKRESNIWVKIILNL